MWPVAWEGLGTFSQAIAPLLCTACPWGFIVAALFLAFGTGTLVGALLVLLVTSANCRRFLWFGFYGILGGLTPAAAAPASLRRRLREYRE